MPNLPKSALTLATLLALLGGAACTKPEAASSGPAPTQAPAPAPVPVGPIVPAAPSAPAENQAAQDAEAAARRAAAELRQAAEAALQDIFFDLDNSEIKAADKTVLQGIAAFLKKYPQARVQIEGHCDARGTVEYNLALGERRAAVARDYLVGLGVAANRLGTLSYGKEKPVCSESTEDCWHRNRRDHFSLQ